MRRFLDVSLVPKLSVLWTEGYSLANLRSDVIAGLTVAVVALPLAMALAIASGSTPDKGLLTAIIAGFLISFLGGSRYQIGGPTAAFIVVVLNTINVHGYEGMLLATIMAGGMLILAGAFRLGTYVKYIPYPVVTGFTAGIAMTILLRQLKDLFGMRLSGLPQDTVALVETYVTKGLHSISLPTLFVGLGTLGLMLFLRRYRSRWPVFLIGTFAGAMVIYLSNLKGLPLDVPTVGSVYKTVTLSVAMPDFSQFTWEKVRTVFPDAVTIAFLAGVEALLSAVVADGMTGRHHRSNIELVAQGTANIASAILGGLPATGAIARTATNIRSGAFSPVAGMLHAVFLLVFVWVAAPLASWIPLATLAAILVIVAWNISEVERFRHLMSAPLGDRVILVSTFLLTVFFDLTVAIKVGVILAALVFMHRMSELVAVSNHGDSVLQDQGEEIVGKTSEHFPEKRELPKGVEVYRITGPFFFGVTGRVSDALDDLREPPKVLILDMTGVPMIDASGVSALVELKSKVNRHGGYFIICGIDKGPRMTLRQMGFHTKTGGGMSFRNHLVGALKQATQMVSTPA